MTKSHGVFFFGGVSLYAFWQVCIERTMSLPKAIKTYVPFLFIPLALILVCTLHYIGYGNFFAYLDIKKNGTVEWSPLKIFSLWSADFEIWKEALIYTFILYLIPIVQLARKKYYFLAIVAIVYYAQLAFLDHPDISRYALPLLPIMALSFSDVLSKKSVYIPMFLCTPMIYLYAVNFMQWNIALAQ